MKKTQLRRCASNYKNLIRILTKEKEDYTDNDLDEYEKFSKLWINDYIELFGRTGCTNYTHMIHAHVPFYMKYKNLSRFSNQGWESLNSNVKTYFFRCTNKGGGGGKGDRHKTKLEALAKWLQRRLMWLLKLEVARACFKNMPEVHLPTDAETESREVEMQQCDM